MPYVRDKNSTKEQENGEVKGLLDSLKLCWEIESTTGVNGGGENEEI